MLKKITGNLENIPELSQKKFLLAISGGIDSIVMAYSFLKSGLNFSLAHCNFKLRGKESDEDQEFVENFARKHQIPLFVKTCDLSGSKDNIQLAARQARYEWFDQLMKQQGFDYLVTAHHLNDSIESFFINLLRGSGLKGLTGIKDAEKILRPMKNVSREEIEKFARENHLKWREDSSNASDKYQRNFIRRHIIPRLKELKPDLENIMLKDFELLQQNQDLTEEWFEIAAKHYIHHDENSQFIELKDLKTLKHRKLFLYNWLSPYGFSDWKAVEQLIDKAQNGKYLISEEYRLSKNKNRIILEKLLPHQQQEKYVISENQTIVSQPVRLSIKLLNIENINNKFQKASIDEAYLDYNKVKFPLTIRKWQAGDYFYPLGMKGKKKLSDFFKDEKMSLSEKEKIWLICDADNNILWIVGKRPDNRFKITNQTEKVLHIKIRF